MGTLHRSKAHYLANTVLDLARQSFKVIHPSLVNFKCAAIHLLQAALMVPYECGL